MLHKRNTTQDVNNYRGISLLDIMGKLYEKVCANRAMAMQVHLADGQGIHAEQMGFNPGHSADDALYSMLEGIKHNRNLGHKVIALSLDAKKAYPSMSRGRMLKCVRDMGYGGNLFQAMSSTYDNNTSAILGGQPGEQSTQYLVKDGLREGAVLSPMLYNIFVASLITELKKAGNVVDGMHVGGIWAGAQTWADDIVIATADRDLKAARAKMTRLMEVTKKWAADNGVTFSTDESEGKGKGKSKVLTFGHAAIQKKWPLGTETDEFKYLGTTINKNLTWQSHVADRMNIAKRKLWPLRKLAKNNGVGIAVCEERWRSTVPSCILHGMGPTNMVRHSWNGLESAFGAGAKCCLGMHRLASVDMACNDLAWLPPQAMVDTAQCMFMWRLLHIAPARTRAVYNAVSTSTADGGARQCTRPWHKHVHGLLGDALGPTALVQCAVRSKIEWRTIVKRAIALKYRRHWLDKIAAKPLPPRQHSSHSSSWATLSLYRPENLARRTGTPVCSRVIYSTTALPAKTGGWCSPAPETQCGTSAVRKCASMGPLTCGSPLQPTSSSPTTTSTWASGPLYKSRVPGPTGVFFLGPWFVADVTRRILSSIDASSHQDN
jgi:hypothetical protein